MTEQEVAIKEFEKEVKLHINTILYEQGYITEKMLLYVQTVSQSKQQNSVI